jgi:2-polyprenyl-6-methoxyphenol hydroxylase-like FAD-dependent oxidoreductase
LRDILLKEAKKRGIPIQFDARCASVDSETAGSASVVFEDGISVKADLVIGTDGI